MAERRMFAKTIIDSDAFLDMPLSTQSLYFHLSMRADDDGFINNAKKIQRMLGCTDDDFKILLSKNFVIPFENGVCVIKHWRIHNLIQKDRYKPTVYGELKDKLSLKNNNVYSTEPSCIQNVSNLETQVSIGKDSQVQESKVKFIAPIPAELLADYMKIRKAKKAGDLTETAFKGIEREALKANISVQRAIEICCERGWVGFKADWFTDRQQSKPSYQDSREAAARTAFGSLLTNQFQVEKVIDHE